MSRSVVQRAQVPAVAALALSASALTVPSSAHGAFGDRALKRGARGHDVSVLQSWLGHLGSPVQVDGHFGHRTHRAVSSYERRERLRVDGRVSIAQARGMRARIERAARVPAVAPPRGRVTLAADGRTAVAPADAPPAVAAAVAAANAIADRPYRYGGGHGRFEDSGYDCSGAVSYVLHGAGLLDETRDSTGLRRFAVPGRGAWISVYARGDHAYVVVGGLRFDTSGRGEEGPRWRREPASTRRYAVRHPEGL